MVTKVLSDHLCCAPKGLSPQNFALFFPWHREFSASRDIPPNPGSHRALHNVVGHWLVWHVVCWQSVSLPLGLALALYGKSSAHCGEQAEGCGPPGGLGNTGGAGAPRGAWLRAKQPQATR